MERRRAKAQAAKRLTKIFAETARLDGKPKWFCGVAYDAPKNRLFCAAGAIRKLLIHSRGVATDRPPTTLWFTTPERSAWPEFAACDERGRPGLH